MDRYYFMQCKNCLWNKQIWMFVTWLPHPGYRHSTQSPTPTSHGKFFCATIKNNLCVLNKIFCCTSIKHRLIFCYHVQHHLQVMVNLRNCHLIMTLLWSRRHPSHITVLKWYFRNYIQLKFVFLFSLQTLPLFCSGACTRISLSAHICADTHYQINARSPTILSTMCLCLYATSYSGWTHARWSSICLSFFSALWRASPPPRVRSFHTTTAYTLLICSCGPSAS